MGNVAAATFFVGAPNQADVVFQRDVQLLQAAEGIECSHAGALIVRGAAAIDLAVLDDGIKGAGDRPAVGHGNAVHVA